MAANSSHGTVAPRRWTRRFDLALVGILLLALLLRLPNLARSLWYDEVGYSAKLGAPSLWGLMRYVLNEPGSLGYRVFMFLWLQVLGENGVVLRLPSLAAGLGAVALTYALARLCVSRQSALLAVVLLALSPVHVWYSQEATPYSMALFLLLAAVYVGSRIRGGTAGRHSYGLYTLLLIAAGLGPFAGTLALALHTSGVLGRLFAEAIENAPPGPGFALRVRGDSMIEAHIVPGDYAVFERREARVGDIVAALIGGEPTLKRLVHKDSRAYLKAENPAYPDLQPVNELLIQGVLVGLVRTTRR